MRMPYLHFFRKYLPLILLGVLGYSAQAQQVVIGSTSGSTSYLYGPYYRSSSGSSFNYSNYCYLYTAAELGIPAGSMITAVEWYKASGTITGNNDFSIWMENTTATSLTSGTTLGALKATATQVYTSTTQSFTAANNSYELFTLPTPFIYSGGSLQILTDHAKYGTASAANNYYYNAATNMGIGYASSAQATAASTLSTTSYGNQRPTIRITYVPGTPCSGAPTAGTANASVINACPGVPFNLSLTGATAASGLAYQWYTRAGSTGPWVAISGATTAGYTVPSQTAATQYRAVVTCTSSTLKDSSTIVAVGQNSFLNCYCTSAANNTADDDIGQVIIGGLTNPASYGTLLSNASSTNVYTDYTSLPATNLSTSTSIPVSITQINSSTFYYQCYLKIYIDLNHNGIFDASEEMFGQNGPLVEASPTFSGSMTIPSSATLGVTRMRIILWESGSSTTVLPCGGYGYGETEDYLVNIIAAPACSGTPTAGTAAASVTTTCAAVPFNLTLTGNSSGATGLSIQWQKRAGTSGPWSNIAGATSSNYTVASQSTASQYRAYITCSNSTLGDTSNVVSVGQNAPLTCYCTPQYTTGCTSDDNINDFTLSGEDATSFNDLATGCSTNGYDNRTAQPAVKLGQGSTYSGTISSTYGSSERAKIWIDFNDNGVFESSDSVGIVGNVPSTATGYTITLPANATLGNHRMRVRLVYNTNAGDIDPCLSYTYGETHDYTVTVILGNDNGRGAIAVNVGGTCSGSPYTNAGSTQGASEPVGLCSSTVGYHSVWYKFVAPASGFVKINTDFSGGSLTDSRVSLFSATDSSNYATYSLIACDDDNGSTSTFMSIIYANGLTPNQTYYVLVDGYGSTDIGTFCLEISNVTNAMLQSTSASCSAALAPFGSTPGYMGWTTLVNSSGQLVALVRNTGTGTTTGGYSGRAVTVNTGAIRQSNSVAYLDRNYFFNNTSSGPYEVVLPFLTSELTALTTAAPGTTLANLKVTRQSGTSCAANFAIAGGTNSVITPSATGGANGVSWVKFTTTGFSNFYLNGTPAPLSIDMKSISAANVNERNRVDWATASEDKGDMFEVERSADGENFTRIGIVAARGTGSEYTYWDAAPFNGTNYYRLKLVNIKGTESYTQVVTANVKSGDAFAVNAYPNPVKDIVVVKVYGDPSGTAAIMITDVTGKVVRTATLNGNQTEINMSGLANGMYMIKYTDNTHIQTIKINKQ